MSGLTAQSLSGTDLRVRTSPWLGEVLAVVEDDLGELIGQVQLPPAVPGETMACHSEKIDVRA
jgi:hypothetical protein